MPTLFLTKLPKTAPGEKTASSTNVGGKSSYLPAKICRSMVYHPVLVSTQNGSRTLLSTPNSEIRIEKSREYSVSNRTS
jgi:hypothetical protein